MKTITLQSAMTALAMLFSLHVHAYDVKVDGIYYDLDRGGVTATVASSPLNTRYAGDITIPQSINYNDTVWAVTLIGDNAFMYCHDLTSITIPNSVTSIGKMVSLGCENLTSIMVDKNNPIYDSRENCNAIIETATNVLIAGCANTVIPNSIVSIGECAFYAQSRLTSVNIPDIVTSIGSSAFYGCSCLTSVIIPNSITDINSGVFFGCTGLKSVTIPNSVTKIDDAAFGGCSGLKDVYCHAHIDAHLSAFYDVKLEDVTLHVPAGDVDIYNNYSIQPWSRFGNIVALPEDDIVFIEDIYYKMDRNTMTATVTHGSSYIGDINIPAAITYNDTEWVVTYIDREAFSGCEGLTSVSIPNSVTSIGHMAFYKCI